MGKWENEKNRILLNETRFKTGVVSEDCMDDIC